MKSAILVLLLKFNHLSVSVFRSESEQHPPMVTQLIVITLESHYYLSDYLRNQTPCFVDISDKIHVLKS